MSGVEFALQLVLRRRPRHRVLLERAASAARARASTRRCRRPGRASTTGADSSRSRPTRGRSTRASGRHRQLEQPAGAGRRRRRTRTSRTAPCSGSSCSRPSSRSTAKHTLASVTAGDEQGGDAGSRARRRSGRSCATCSARRRRRALAGGRGGGARRRVGLRRRQPARRATSTAGSTLRAPRFSTPRGRDSPTRCSRPAPRPAHRRGSRRCNPRSDDPGPAGSAYGAGWYGYVDKDLRTLLGRPVRGAYSRRYCGAADLERLPRGALGGDRSRRGRARGDAGPGAVDVAGGCDARADPLHVGRVPGHDALDEPADVPAADVVLRPPSALSGSRRRHRR